MDNRMQSKMQSKKTLVFFVNGQKIEDSAVDPECTLLFYLRDKLRLCGTKLACGEGGCGACTVMLSKYHRNENRIEHYSVNACLAPVAVMHGLAVTTVEGIGSTKTRLHAVQERIAKAHGSQCGFCTPGMVMSMYTLLRNHPVPSMEQLDEYFTGNLCRCTGYRPILDGFRTFSGSSDGGASSPQGCGKSDCCRLQRNGGCGGEAAMNGGAKDGSASVTNGWSMNRQLQHEDDFTPYDPSRELIFPPELKVRADLDQDYLELRDPRVSFHRPTSLNHLLHLKALHPQAKIIVGNTEVGVETKFKNQMYPVLINPSIVPEVTEVRVVANGVEVGSAVTLTALHTALANQVDSLPEYRTRIFSAILEMLRWFAGRQIRNAAAIGGNVMTGSPISDLNPLLMAAGATLTLCSSDGGERTVPMDDKFFTGYRKNIVKPEEVLLSVHIPFTHEDEYFMGYKQARRRDDDIAIVNAGCKVSFRPGTALVSHLSLAFGGMAPTTVMALSTMKGLEGRVWDASLLEEGTSLLLQDLPLPPSAPGGMTEYRSALTISFFFKFYLSVRGRLSELMPELIPALTSDEQRATQLHHQTQSSNTQLFEKVPEDQPEIDPIGRPKVHASAMKQATGEAVYVDDMPTYTNELYAAMVLSSRAHAKILAIDESKALKMEGVEGFFCHRDLPGERNKTAIPRLEEEVFASSEVVCVGQLIGMVVAKDRATARTAAKLVIVQYQDLPSIITIQDAIREKSWWKPTNIRKGNAEVELESSAHTLEGEMYIGGQEHFYFETNAHLAVPKNEDGELELYSSTQNPSDTQALVARALGVASNKVVCRVKRMGGGFGGKESRTTMVSVPLCVAANALGRPVRIMLDRDEDMLMTGGRHPFLCRWRVGFTPQGVLKAVDVDLYANSGHSLDLSIQVVERAMLSLDNGYRLGVVRVTGYACKTNLPSNTAFRGFGSPQSMLFIENIVTQVAASLNLDPFLVRERNLNKTGDVTHYNHPIERCTLQRCWQECVEQADYHTRTAAATQYNRENRYRKRGLAVVPVKYGVSFTAVFYNQAGALVCVYKDGSVLLSHGGTEMGQGLHTKMIQVASRALKIPSEQIYIMDTSTDKIPNASPTAASTSSDINGMAVLEACSKILSRLVPIIASNPKGTWKEWVREAYMNRMSLSATGFYKTPELSPYDFEKNEGRIFSYFCYGTAVSEVEIDCLTGDHSVLRTDIVMDVGESLNPAIDIGQIEGAFMQGQGLFTLEELLYSPEGDLLTRGPGAYKIPGFQDIPQELNVSLLRGAPNPKAVFSSKAVGEPPLFLAASVFFSIRKAIEAARADQGLSPLFRLDSPATAERIRMACQDFLTQKIEPSEPGSFKPWSVIV